MSELPPNWAFEMYSKLWMKFKNNKFSNDEAHKIIKDDNLNQGLSRLKKDGWLKISLDPEDARKSIYILKEPKETIDEIIKEKSNKNEKK